MPATHMEHVLQHGFVLAEITKLIKARPTLNDAKLWRVEFTVERNSGRRHARVFLTPLSPTEPKFVFEILERDKMESAALWESGTRARLREGWAKAFSPPEPATEPAKESPSVTESATPQTDQPPPLEEAPVAIAPKPRARAGRGTNS